MLNRSVIRLARTKMVHEARALHTSSPALGHQSIGMVQRPGEGSTRTVTVLPGYG